MSTPGDIREELLASNPEFQRLAQEHSRYEAQLEQLTRSAFLNAEDLIQEIQLKKLKLRAKDRMECILAEAAAGRDSKRSVMAAVSR
jgi:uncharacterized protein YdcH (DUF465 family)